MIRWLAAFIIALAALPLQAQEEVVLGMSQNRVAITANFDGSEILIFGAVKREEPIPQEANLEVIVAISGPLHPVTVRRKDRRFGIWVNVDSVEVDEAPSFYAVATSAPFSDILSAVEDQRHHVSIPQSIRLVGEAKEGIDPKDFAEAVMRIRTNAGLYKLEEGTVEFSKQTLFNTRIALPSNLTEGDYSTRVFLTRNGKVISQFETKIDVSKVGLERWLFNLSRQQPLAYGLLSLAIAIAAGWGASAAFKLLRQG